MAQDSSSTGGEREGTNNGLRGIQDKDPGEEGRKQRKTESPLHERRSETREWPRKRRPRSPATATTLEAAISQRMLRGARRASPRKPGLRPLAHRMNVSRETARSRAGLTEKSLEELIMQMVETHASGAWALSRLTRIMHGA